jgi:hypothetical protein
MKVHEDFKIHSHSLPRVNLCGFFSLARNEPATNTGVYKRVHEDFVAGSMTPSREEKSPNFNGWSLGLKS